MSVIKIKDDAGNWIPINRVIKPSPLPKLVATASYPVPASGGEFWIDTVAAGGDVTLLLPLAPANNTIVSTQIVDNGTNNLYLTPTAPDTIGYAAVGLSGKYTGTSRNLGETLRYVNGRWLPYYGRLVYQAAIAAIVLPPETVFFAMFEGANNSTAFTDLRANPISVRSGTPKISTAQSMFGNGSLYLDGNSSLSVAAAPILLAGLLEFDWEIALYPTAFTSGVNQGILDQRLSQSSSAPEALVIYNTTTLGVPGHFTGSTALGLSRIKLNQWQILRVVRYQGIKTIYLDDVPVYSGADSSSYTEAGNLVIGDILDTGGAFAEMFQGYIQYIRKTIGSSRKQGYGTDARTFTRPPLTDADPLDMFKVLDINCDGGSIIDTKGHVITPSGAVAVSSAQKRAGSHSIALTGGYLDIAGGNDFNFGSAPYSVQVSLNMSVVNSNQYFIDFDGGNTSSLSSIGTDWLIAFNNAISNLFTETITVNTWYELAVAKIDTTFLLIRNNQIVAVSNNAPTTANFATMRVGGYRGGGITIQGYMDSVAAYKGIANGSNLTHSYPLRFLARFSGGSPNDELGALGTIVGAVPTYDTTVKRSLEASALFAGTGHITYPAIQLGAGGFEIAGWCKSNPNQVSYPGILSIGTASGVLADSQTYTISASIAGSTSLSGKSTVDKLSVFCGAVTTNSQYLCSTTLLSDGLPHYWRIIKYITGASACTVMVIDGKIEDVYLGAYTIAPTTRSMLIGADNYDASSRQFKGNQDDIAIYQA
jgi:hypothetical protein